MLERVELRIVSDSVAEIITEQIPNLERSLVICLEQILNRLESLRQPDGFVDLDTGCWSESKDGLL